MPCLWLNVPAVQRGNFPSDQETSREQQGIALAKEHMHLNTPSSSFRTLIISRFSRPEASFFLPIIHAPQEKSIFT